MRLVTFWLVILGLLLIAKHSLADDVSIKGGPALFDGKPEGTAKIFGVRSEERLFYGVRQAIEFGGWADSVEGRKSSFYTKWQLGVSPGPETGVYASAFIGPVGISHADALLGGHLQFAEDAGVGVRDRTSFVLLGYSHFSSAGLSKPNKGRDFLTFSAGVRF